MDAMNGLTYNHQYSVIYKTSIFFSAYFRTDVYVSRGSMSTDLVCIKNRKLELQDFVKCKTLIFGEFFCLQETVRIIR